MNIDTCLKAGALKIAEVSDSASLDAQLLLGKVLNKSREWLLAFGETTLLSQQIDSYQDLITQRCQGVPVAYLVGYKYFFGLKFAVNRKVLIPRPATECLVEWVLSKCDCSQRRVLDLGTGSGAIIVSLAKNRAQWDCFAVDVCDEALAVAKLNAERHQIDTIEFKQSDWFESIRPVKYDIIIANPPYIAADDDHLPSLQCEPSLALVAAERGLKALYLILKEAKSFLISGGVLVLEHGYEQQSIVMRMAEEEGYIDVAGYADLSGQPRFVVATHA